LFLGFFPLPELGLDFPDDGLDLPPDPFDLLGPLDPDGFGLPALLPEFWFFDFAFDFLPLDFLSFAFCSDLSLIRRFFFCPL